MLVVEDDPALRGVLARGLREQGAVVTAVADGSSALSRFTDDGGFDVVVMDVGLPDSDGRDVCQALRARGVYVPVLFLTARGNVTDLVSGFAAGGDEYVAKPFHFAELVARLGGLLKRARSSPVSVPDGLRLDPRGHALAAATTSVRLTPTEYRVLARLMASPGVVVRRRELVGAGWPEGAIVHDNTLDQYVAKLRRKLALVDGSQAITTVHGIGYQFT
ncbi:MULTISPECIES: response regulator transcription factor [unclassified Frankia]|uniref:response regulator transcription factor n=1 Tax=unclassified Frankia TaxID=2632575 RepID=UPI002AD23298|nr:MULTISPECIES: response regulator transcription factor [unclassified Frankia]